jgi:hypothetical protein
MQYKGFFQVQSQIIGYVKKYVHLQIHVKCYDD